MIDDESVIDNEVRAEAFRMYALKFASKTVMDTVANAGKTIQSKFDVNADAGSPFASWGIIQAVDVMKLRDDAVKRGEDDKKASEYLSRSAADEAQRARWEAEKDWTEKMVKKMQAAGVEPSGY
jgi:Arc/MetJ family transcription regulator